MLTMPPITASKSMWEGNKLQYKGKSKSSASNSCDPLLTRNMRTISYRILHVSRYTSEDGVSSPSGE